MSFERSGRGQEPSRGHKFSILENLVLHRDFTSQTLASFDVILLGACLPQTLLRTDEEELCQIDTIPPQQFMRVKLQNNARHIPRIFPEIPAAYPDHYTSHGWTSEIRYSRMERREKGTLP